jgi:hypothetical protein
MGYKSSNKLHVYDAGYIKLREASLTYNFSAETLERLPFTTAPSIIGRNYGLSKTLRMQILKLVFWKCSRLSIWCLPFY